MFGGIQINFSGGNGCFRVYNTVLRYVSVLTSPNLPVFEFTQFSNIALFWKIICESPYIQNPAQIRTFSLKTQTNGLCCDFEFH